jgi:hypothetical protein
LSLSRQLLFPSILTVYFAAALVVSAAAAWGYQSWQAAVDGWYNEVELYNFARPGFSGATGEPRLRVLDTYEQRKCTSVCAAFAVAAILHMVPRHATCGVTARVLDICLVTRVTS